MTNNLSGKENVLLKVFLGIKGFAKITIKIVEYILQAIYFLLSPIYRMIEKSKYRWHIYIFGGLFVIIASLIMFFWHDLKMKWMEGRISYQNYITSNIKDEKNGLQETIKDIQKQLVVKTKALIVSEKELCESSQYEFYLREFHKNSVYPSDLDIEILKLKIATEECALSDIKSKVMKQVKSQVDALFENTETQKSSFEENLDNMIKPLQTKETQDAQELEDKYAILDKAEGDEKEEYVPKSKTPIKAVFCSYGHGISMKGEGVRDNGYVANKSDYPEEQWNQLGEYIKKHGFGYMYDNWKAGMITERSLVEYLNSYACEEIKKTVESQGIAFYSIGEASNPMNLGQKIDLINKIMVEKGYKTEETVAYELHSNSVVNPEKSGLEVFYSSKKMKNNGLQGKDAALTMLNAIAPVHDKLNGDNPATYVVKPDHKSRHAYLGFTTLTKANAILVEYGFKKNFSDLSLMIKNREEVGKSIADGILNFIK